MHFVNEKWAAGALNMSVNSQRGPDLIDNEKAVEVKFERIYPDVKFHKCWRFLGHQLDYDKEHNEIYWALGFYYFNKHINKINKKDLSRLDSFVSYRDLYVVNWGWMKQFPLYHQKGKTKLSEWDHYIGYPKFSKIPSIILSKEVDGGKLYFTEGVNPERFNFALNQGKIDNECPF
jgi:hypothetical protein